MILLTELGSLRDTYKKQNKNKKITPEISGDKIDSIPCRV